MQRVVVLLLFLQAAACYPGKEPILEKRKEEEKGTWQQTTTKWYLQYTNVGVLFNAPTTSPPLYCPPLLPHNSDSLPISSSISSSSHTQLPAPLLTREVVSTLDLPVTEGNQLISSLVSEAAAPAVLAANVAEQMLASVQYSAETETDSFKAFDEKIEQTGNSPEVEDEDANPEKAGINIENYLKCFDNLPDAGAQFTIKVMVDIPVDANPNSLINLAQTGLSVGHVFVTISKTVGNQTISQTLGFYPASDYKSVSLSPVTSKLADDGASETGHEYNASIMLDGWNAAEFRAFLTQIRYNARMRYEIDAFNCANFIGSSLNAVRPNSLFSVSTTGINPLNPTELINIPWSPNGVYKALVDLKATNPRLAPKIEVNVIKYCKPSKGPCS